MPCLLADIVPRSPRAWAAAVADALALVAAATHLAAPSSPPAPTMAFEPSGLYEYRAEVSSYPAGIYDGDTFRLDIDSGFRRWMLAAKCRLADVNCPSIKGDERPDGLAARDRVRDLLAPPVEIRIRPKAADPVKYGRYLVDLAFRPYPPSGDPERWHDLGAVLIDEGHAAPYP